MAAAGASQFTFCFETPGIDLDCKKAIALANEVHQVRLDGLANESLSVAMAGLFLTAAATDRLGL
jgi:hypothetical protein